MNIQELGKDLEKIYKFTRRDNKTGFDYEFYFKVKYIDKRLSLITLYEIYGEFEIIVTFEEFENENFHIPYLPRVWGKGYFIGSQYNFKRDKLTKRPLYYRIWQDVFQRVFFFTKYNKNHPKESNFNYYEKTDLDTRWYNFKNFYLWCENKEISNYKIGFQLDKDLFSNKYNKKYGPDTCVFIPQYLNSLLKYNSNNKYSPGVSVNSNPKRTEKKYFVAEISILNSKNVWLGLFHTEHEAFCLYYLFKKIVIETKAYRALQCGDINKRIFKAFINYYPHFINCKFDKDFVFNHFFDKFQIRKSSDDRNNLKMLINALPLHMKMSEGGAKILKEYLDLNIL